MDVLWKGVYPALTTKFDKNEEPDYGLFVKNLLTQLDAGVHGIILGGTLGEASTLTGEEKERLVSISLETSDKRVPVILNIAEGSTREAVHQAKLASKWGADGLMLLPPMRYKADERECTAYFMAVANATDLPVMIYNNPVDYKVEVTPAMFERLMVCPNILAVKESTRDVSNVTRLKSLFGDRLKVLCGVDTLAMESLVMGADGWVAGLVCAYPYETMAVYDLVRMGRYDEAREIYRWFLPLLELDIHPKLVQYIKLAEQMEGLGSEYVRSPRLTLLGEERDRVLSVIEKAKSCRPDLKKINLKNRSV